MKTISVQERRANQKYIKVFAYFVFILCVPYLLIKKNRYKIMSALKVISFPVSVFAMFMFGQMEHPSTPVAIRFCTSVVQSSLLFLVFCFVKNTVYEVIYDIKNILN